MHLVTKVDWSADTPLVSPTSSGLVRTVLVGRDSGATHTELAATRLSPGGWLGRHRHSFEEALYVLGGELIVELDRRVHRLRPGDFILMTIGTWHALVNAGTEEVRLLSVNTPQRLPPDAGRRDTFFDGRLLDPSEVDREAKVPDLLTRHPPRGALRRHSPQAEALRVPYRARGRAPAGMDTALLAYSGISVKMLVDRVFGADLLTMFTVDYEIGGAAQAHDHPFEESYFFLAGEVEAELDGEHHVLRPGDVVFAGVGSLHGFYNTGTERVRWIEIQAPQPPTRHAYRWAPTWARLEAAEGGR
jgi:quercetin dioxygenase-like cupin family protein